MKKITALLIAFLLLFSGAPIHAATNQNSVRRSPVYAVSQRFRSDWFREWFRLREERLKKEEQIEKEQKQEKTEDVVEIEEDLTINADESDLTDNDANEDDNDIIDNDDNDVDEDDNDDDDDDNDAIEIQGKNVLDYGAKGDGSTNDTAAIQAALNENERVFIPDGTYCVNVDRPLAPKSGQVINLSDNAILKALPSKHGYNAVIRLLGVSDVSISGGKIVGERYDHIGDSGEWGMGIHVIKGSRNIQISDIEISDCWGDGIFIGDSPTVTDVVIDNVISDNNRRQGLSITDAKNIVVKNSVFKNTNGTKPEAGIDIEPDEGQTSEDIQLINVKCQGNSGSGIDLMGITGLVKDISITDSDVTSNDGMGIRLVNSRDVTISNGKVIDNLYGIEIERDVFNASFSNMIVSQNQKRGLSLVTYEQEQGVEKIAFEDSVFSNNSQKTAGKYDGVRIDAWDSTGYIKDVKFSGCQFIDDQVDHTQGYGITVGFNDKISDIIYDGQSIFKGNINGDLIADSLILNRI